MRGRGEKRREKLEINWGVLYKDSNPHIHTAFVVLLTDSDSFAADLTYECDFYLLLSQNLNCQPIAYILRN